MEDIGSEHMVVEARDYRGFHLETWGEGDAPKVAGATHLVDHDGQHDSYAIPEGREEAFLSWLATTWAGDSEARRDDEPVMDYLQRIGVSVRNIDVRATAKKPLSVNERKRVERDRMRAAGYVLRQVWVRPTKWPLIKTCIERLNDTPESKEEDPSMEQQIWHLHSKVLRGFYQSEVIVLATGKDAAVDAACEAFAGHIDAELREMLFCSVNCTYLDPEDDDYPGDRARVEADFRCEAEAGIRPVEGGRMVMHKV